MNGSALTVSATIAATVAALAGSAQAYISWSGRNDLLKATLLSGTVQKCAELSLASQKYLDNFHLRAKYLTAGKSAPADQVDDYKSWLVLEEKMVPVQFFLSTIDERLYPELQKWPDMINEAAERYFSKPEDQRTIEDVNGMRDMALKLSVSMQGICSESIRKHSD